jgi:hypothetical protein
MKNSGYYFTEGMPLKGRPPAGKEHDSSWTDYKLWSGDFWQCEGCGHTLISGTGRSPIAEHYMPDFKAQKERLGATFRVNDC